MSDDEALVLRRGRDGRVTVEEWFQRIRISPEFLFDEGLIETVITIRAANGTRRYRVVGCTQYDVLAELLVEDARRAPVIAPDPETMGSTMGGSFR